MPTAARFVIVFVVDGLRPDAINDRDTPALSRLRADGVEFANGHAVFPTVTRVNAAALREITDTSGGRTEIVRSAHDLNPATAGIADELSRQYYLGYSYQGQKDGRWHAIRVEVRDNRYHVRARRGFVATP